MQNLMQATPQQQKRAVAILRDRHGSTYQAGPELRAALNEAMSEPTDICEHSTGAPCESCTEPRICDRCNGSSYIEARVGLAGLTEKRCPGETDDDECDGGIVR